MKLSISFGIALSTVFATLPSGEALQLKFSRFSQPGCVAKYHIRNDVKLTVGECHTFHADEPVFEAYRIYGNPSGKPLQMLPVCQAVVYGETKCLGDGYTVDDVFKAESVGEHCTELPSRSGRSVRLQCQSRVYPTSTSTITGPTSTESTTMNTGTTTIYHVVSSPSSASTSTTTTTMSTTMPALTVTSVASPTSSAMTTITLGPHSTKCSSCCHGDCA